MVGPVAARILPAVLALFAMGLVAAQEPARVTPYNSLTTGQRRLLAGWASGLASTTERQAAVRGQYDAAPESFRLAFGHVTARLSSLQLSDPENGEVLGSAIELVEFVEPLDRQPATGDAPSTLRLAVALAPGARDRLRRSAEFERVGDGAPGRVEFLHEGPPSVRISADAAGTRAHIAVGTR